MIVLVVWRTERIKQNEVEKLSDSLQEKRQSGLHARYHASFMSSRYFTKVDSVFEET